MKKIVIKTDGGSRGNPGPAGIGVVIKYGDIVKELSEYIGEATNNVAEYTAVAKALEWVKKNIKDDDIVIDFSLDSQLVVEQLNGRYKMKNEGLKPLFWQIRDLIMELGGKVAFTHIPRTENTEADKLVNKALDQEMERP